eukprot:scaffold26353_cov90-Isochrysis_galbana.AAC.1
MAWPRRCAAPKCRGSHLNRRVLTPPGQDDGEMGREVAAPVSCAHAPRRWTIADAEDRGEHCPWAMLHLIALLPPPSTEEKKKSLEESATH